MALDMVVKFMIILVVAGIVIGLFLIFSEDAKKAVENLFGGEKKPGLEVKTLNQNSFSSGQVAQYIESCYDAMSEIPEADQEDKVCYVLMAQSSFNSFVSQSDIFSSLPKELKSRVKFNTNFNLSYLKIEFKELGDEIVVS